jgi:BirA family transcriptional regulator, biotin operon repressor / biotin---[acetyl-CoA-carboxylase] ligase
MNTIIIRFDSIGSTNTEAARQAAAGAAEGLCVVAREQTAGRGREQRSWNSPRDAGLYVSVVLRPRIAPSHWGLITLTAAIAVADAMNRAMGLDVDIKWPNDIHVQSRKLCGILAETVETISGRAVVLGIGVNLKRTAYPLELAVAAISIEELAQNEPDAEELLAALLNRLGYWYDQLQTEGGRDIIIGEWSSRSSYAEGKPVRAQLRNEVINGITRGLEPDGGLRVETEAGEMKVVRAGDVSALRANE